MRHLEDTHLSARESHASEARENGINHCDVLFSDELPVKALTASELEGKTVRNIPGSISFVPSVAGLIIAGEVVRRLSAAGETDER